MFFRLEKHLDDLLQQISVVIDKHTDSEVFAEIYLVEITYTRHHCSQNQKRKLIVALAEDMVIIIHHQGSISLL